MVGRITRMARYHAVCLVYRPSHLEFPLVSIPFQWKFTPARTTSAIINIVLLAAILCCMVSSVLVSGKVFAFLNLGGARFGRTLHLISTAWHLS